jgi:superfamily II DNA or RNA helicase
MPLESESTWRDHDLLRELDRNLIEAWLGMPATAQGEVIQRQGRIQRLSARAENASVIVARAEVVDSRSRPEQVTIRLERGAARLQMIGTCSCARGRQCLHVAGMLFEMLVTRSAGESGGSVVAEASPEPPNGAVGTWVQALRAATGGVSQPQPESADRVIYLLDVSADPSAWSFQLSAAVIKRLKDGGYGQARACTFETLLASTASYTQPEDRTLARLLMGGSSGTGLAALPDDSTLMTAILQRLMATGRCYWQNRTNPPLTQGPARAAGLDWRLHPDGRQAVVIAPLGDAVRVLMSAAPWYVDIATATAGPLTFAVPEAVVRAMLRAPLLAPDETEAVALLLGREFPAGALPVPHVPSMETVEVAPVPCVRLISHLRWRSYSYSPRELMNRDMIDDYVLLMFDYDGGMVEPRDSRDDLREVVEGRIRVRRRQRAAEQAAQRRLTGFGFRPSPEARPGETRSGMPGLSLELPGGTQAWLAFVHRGLPELAAAGWRIEIDPDFRHRVIDASGEWRAEFDDGEAGGWWFSLDLGIEVGGQTIPLLPVLVAALQNLPESSAIQALERLSVGETLYAPLPDGGFVALPMDRVRGLLSVLVELFDIERLGADGRLTVSLGEAAGLAALEAVLQLRWLGGERLRTLAASLADFTGIEPVPPPEGLAAVLRPYQQAGLDWLQFLGRHGLGGILADDMGLGKTVQTLAHLLVEKHAGRLSPPALVVCPTSVVPNWEAEVTRFAPALTLLVLHGPERARLFEDIADADLVLTSYALLVRDAGALINRDWSVIVLDEAQAIKNPQARITQQVARLRGNSRLCLTGTPVENHLGELWSQFAFLMPGLLGTARQFARLFRTPIEKKGTSARQAVLAARTRPFLLRRTKAAVAPELPPKTEIIQRIEFECEQRDLYETVRLSMHAKVQRAVAEKGLGRSRIVILDALLKLRQVCCDPRLVKLTAARQSKAGSAKLTALLEMLPEMIEEGRRVLLFSQFTSMLDLIRPALTLRGVPFVELRGDTTDRATPVARFQSGKVPLFLISLKAGGTGLNLTAADTVIHYDPWWNPAVESQATDRAHRIGQDKPVFVYKLIALGTVEERILDLQQRKRLLAGVIFDAESGGTVDFEPEDLELLFQPLA